MPFTSLLMHWLNTITYFMWRRKNGIQIQLKETERKQIYMYACMYVNITTSQAKAILFKKERLLCNTSVILQLLLIEVLFQCVQKFERNRNKKLRILLLNYSKIYKALGGVCNP